MIRPPSLLPTRARILPPNLPRMAYRWTRQSRNRSGLRNLPRFSELTGQTFTITGPGGTTADAIAAIAQVIENSQGDMLLASIANKLRPLEPDYARRVFDFAYNAARFEADPPKHQRIRTPRRLMQDGRGNCVDYTVLICALFLVADMPATFKVVAQRTNEGVPAFNHIYAIAPTGEILDCVLGQSENFRPESGQFNKEVQYISSLTKTIQPMRIDVLNGDTATINDSATINATDYDEYEVAEVMGCPCQSVNGAWVPLEMNGVAVEMKPDGVSDEDYQRYLLAVALGDPDATAVDGIFQFLKRSPEKKAAAQDKKEQKRQRREALTGQRVEARNRRAKEGSAFSNLLKGVTGFLGSKGKAVEAEATLMLKQAEQMGIQPDDEGVASIIEAAQQRVGDGGRSGDGFDFNKNLPLIGGGLLLAYLVFKK